MKKILILTFLISSLFAGCMTDSINNSPVAVDGQKLVWLTVSDNAMKTEAEIVVSKTINGSQGGKLTINESVGKVQVSGTLTIPQGSYPGNQTISIAINDISLYQVYTPSPYVFRIPLVLDLVYKNVQLSVTDPNQIAFYYLSDDGNYYRAQYDSLIYDSENRTIGVLGAKLPHFSRWGWAKVEED
jgi:hypothetical protein